LWRWRGSADRLFRHEDASDAAEIGKNRMPSVQALQVISEAQTALRSASRAIDAMAPYPDDVASRMRSSASRRAGRASTRRGNLRCLPQEPEEEKVWNVFVKQWDAWKQRDALITDSPARSRAEPAKRKELFLSLHKTLKENRTAFHDAEESLNKLVS
jgi:methyl-accepting chemotaxis protein